MSVQMKNNEHINKFYQYAFPMLTVIVTCTDKNQITNMITISWQTTLSKKPPLYGISIAPTRHSYKIISQQKAFVVNFLESKHLKDVHFCGTHSGRNTDKLANTKFTLIPGHKVTTAKIKEAYAHFECALFDSQPVGDHILLIGEVVHVSADSNKFQNELLDIQKIQPIYYRGGNSYTQIDKEFIYQF